MEKLDCSEWAAGLALVSHGVRIGFRTNRPEILRELGTCIPPGARRCPAEHVDRLYSLRVGDTTRPNVRFFHLLYADATLMVRSMDLRDVFIALEYDLEVYVAERARGRIFVHAGAVALNGQAIVMPGHSRSGKTTLVAALVRAGATYFSDEYAIVDVRGRVHPYPRLLSIRSESDGESFKLPVEALGGRPGRQPLPVGTVLVTRFEEGGVWRPRTLSAGETVLQLLAHTVSVRSEPKRALTAVLRIARRAKTLGGVRGHAEDLVDALLEHSRA